MYEGPIQVVIDELSKLPGLGPKGAQRIAFYLLKLPAGEIDSLVSALHEVRDKVQYCKNCFMVSAGELCKICANANRDNTKICVVEEPKDVLALERTGQFGGLYHVLGGALNPLHGVGPEDLEIRSLLKRVGGEGELNKNVKEIIIATDPDIEGEATATYLVRMFQNFPDLIVTKLASGLPMGGELEFADEITLGQALSGRRSIAN